MANFPKNTWLPIFEQAKRQALFQQITEKLTLAKGQGKVVFPPSQHIFRAFELCDFDQLKVVLLGQDPYHGVGEANGLCFSVQEGIRTPPSLKNIFKELQNEYPDFNEHRSTDLSDWARQGILMLNAVLTVEKDQPASHADFGWQLFTDYIIQEISLQRHSVVFLLLGKFAQSKIPLIDTSKHKILTAAHPSPFSVHRGFFGSKVFTLCNEYLKANGHKEINWGIRY